MKKRTIPLILAAVLAILLFTILLGRTILPGEPEPSSPPSDTEFPEEDSSPEPDEEDGREETGGEPKTPGQDSPVFSESEDTPEEAPTDSSQPTAAPADGEDLEDPQANGYEEDLPDSSPPPSGTDGQTPPPSPEPPDPAPADDPGAEGESETAGEPGTEIAPQPLDFTVYDLEGASVALSSFYGEKPILIHFWTTWFEPCVSQLPTLDTLYGQLGDQIVLLMVNLTDGEKDTAEGVKAFLAENDYSFPVYLDTDASAATACGVVSVPTSVLVGPDGTVFGSQVGTVTERQLSSYLRLLEKYIQRSQEEAAGPVEDMS